jgi:DNA-binding FadR family transcriptional regulator
MSDLAVDDEVQAEYERQVEKVAAEVLKIVQGSGQGVGLLEVLSEAHGRFGVSRAVLREAILGLLYTGVLALTEEHQLTAH